MSDPMNAGRFLDIMDLWDIDWGSVHADWRGHNRNHKGPWDNLNGVMIHHTGSDNQTNMKQTLWDGYAALPGPLCHAGIDAKGKVWLTGWGRANHAGLGDSDVLKKVRNEKYTGNLKPRIADVDGNRHFYGFEVMYSGSHAMTDAQLLTVIRLSAAICTEHKWTYKSVIGHGEWQPGKWDPGYAPGKIMDMSKSRAKINAAIKAGPKSKPDVRNYRVKAGDTLYSIAANELGDPKRFGEIVTLNPSIINLPRSKKLILPGE